jgi:APA family basic amino acid/polyamine antiporter
MSDTQARLGGEGAVTGVFVRDATGLVREVSWFDAAVYNMIWSSVPLAIAFLLLFGTAFYTGGNLYLAAVAAFVVTIATGFLYAMLSAAVPRSGGDYTWISRALSPPLAFMSNVSWNFWITFFVGVYAAYTTSYGLSPLLRLWAAQTGSVGLLSVANFLVTRNGTLIVGLVIVLLSGLLLAYSRGLRGFLRLQRWTFILWFVGAMLIPIVVLFVVGRHTVFTRFDTYVAALGGPRHATAGILKAGAAAARAPFSFRESVLMLTLPFYSLAFIFQSVYFGGEIKRAKRSGMLSIPGAHFFATVLILVATGAFLTGAGRDFLAGLALTPPGKYKFAFTPLYTEVAAVASGNIIVGTIIILGFTSMLVIFVAQTMLQLSRNIFAWSFDRLLPERVAEVNPRTHSPVIAVAVITAVSVISVIIISLNPQLTFLVGLVGLCLTYLCVAVSGILFPYRRREVFEASPYNHRLGKIPVMTIVGALSLVTMAAAVVNLLLDPNSGTNWYLNTNRVVLVGAVFVIALPAFYTIRAIQRRRGVNIDLAFKEIPPE